MTDQQQMSSVDLQSVEEARQAIAQAKKAQKVLGSLTQEKVDRIVAAMAQAGFQAAEMLGRLAAGETGLGRVESKTAKNQFCTQQLYDYLRELKTVGVIRSDKAAGISEIAEPVGIIAAIIPVTNPTSTTLFKGLISLKARNTVIFSPHPRAVRCVAESAQVIYRAALAAGAPEGCIRWLTSGQMAGTQELMRHRDVALILATGGPGLVKAAYQSGKPAIGVGPGNVPVFIERSAHLAHAVGCVIESQRFDFGTVCSSEQAVVTEQVIAEQVVAQFKRQGAYFLNAEESAKVEAVAIHGEMMSPEIVGQSPERIAQMAGISIPTQTSVLLAPLQGVGPEYPLSRETLCPLLKFYVERDWVQARQRCLEILRFGGLGHTLVIHSTNPEMIMELAAKAPASRILVNAPATQGAIGLATHLVPSMTLGCGAAGNNITSDNISPLHLINIKRTGCIESDFPLWEDGREIDPSVMGFVVRPEAMLRSESTSPLKPARPDSPISAVEALLAKKKTFAGRGWPFSALAEESKEKSSGGY